MGEGSKDVGLSNVALAWMIDQLRDIVAFGHEAVSIISQEDFPPEKDRYHLYVSYACPWGMYFCCAAVSREIVR